MWLQYKNYQKETQWNLEAGTKVGSTSSWTWMVPIVSFTETAEYDKWRSLALQTVLFFAQTIVTLLKDSERIEREKGKLRFVQKRAILVAD